MVSQWRDKKLMKCTNSCSILMTIIYVYRTEGNEHIKITKNLVVIS